MQVPNFFNEKPPARIPEGLKLARSAYIRLEQKLSWLYGSRWNPISHSGAIAMTLILILIATGVPLLFIYRVSAPYASIADNMVAPGLGSILRTVHRYSTDLTAWVIGLHVLKIILEGKTWGPRTLAWTTGVILLGIFLLSSYTGFILVWDRFGLQIGKSGAAILDLLPYLPTPPSRNFSGDVAIGNSFFFLNLFMHIAIPLGIVATLTVHLSRVKKPAWILKGPVALTWIVLLLVIAFLFPVSLDAPADLLSLDRSFRSDTLFSVWVVLQNKIGAGFTFFGFISVFGVFFSVPWLWKPRPSSALPRSEVDELHCEGCTQCVQDCPFEAIEMRARTLGTGSPLVAHVQSELCVSCGICSGSCNQFSIGPAPWKGRIQLQSIPSPQQQKKSSVVLCCANRRLPSLPENLTPLRVECVGILHAATITKILQHYSEVFVWGCSDGECGSRMGGTILRERMEGTRTPTLPPRIDKHRVHWLQSELSPKEIADAIGSLVKGNTPSNKAGLSKNVSAKIVVAGVFLFSIVKLSAQTIAIPDENSELRLAWRSPGKKNAVCRPRTPDELAALPAHMRTPTVCKESTNKYRLEISVDGSKGETEEYASKGYRSDRPIIVNKIIPLSPGKHTVRLSWSSDSQETQTTVEQLEFTADFPSSRARIVSMDSSAHFYWR